MRLEITVFLILLAPIANVQICLGQVSESVAETVNKNTTKIEAALSFTTLGVETLYLLDEDRKTALVLEDRTLKTVTDMSNLEIAEGMNVKAACMLSAKDETPDFGKEFLYYGDKYTYYQNTKENGAKQKRDYGLYSDLHWIFRNGGPDAAARKGDDVYVFKGCKMVIRQSKLIWGTPRDVRGEGLPCDIDAAWKSGEEMIILKGDQYWRWEKNDSVNGPENIKDYLDLKEWTILPVSG